MSERALSIYSDSGFASVGDIRAWTSADMPDVLNLARRFFPMPQDRRGVIRALDESAWEEVHLEYIQRIVQEAHELSVESLKRIGLTPELYMETIASMVSNNVSHLRRIIAESEKKMNRKKSAKTTQEAAFQPVYDPVLMEKHQPLIDSILNSVEPTEKPNIIILVGPPGCGKTEVFKQEKDCQPGQAVNIDIDEIRKLLSPVFDPKDQALVEQYREEAWRFADNLLAQCIATKRSVVLQTSLARKEFWLHNSLLHEAIDQKQFSMRVKVIMRDIHDSFRRAMLRGMPMDRENDLEGRMVALGDFMEATEGYKVVRKFVREYKAKLELHDYQQLSQGKTRLKSKVRERDFKKLRWMTTPFVQWLFGIQAEIVEKVEDVQIEKNKKVRKHL